VSRLRGPAGWPPFEASNVEAAYAEPWRAPGAAQRYLYERPTSTGGLGRGAEWPLLAPRKRSHGACGATLCQRRLPPLLTWAGTRKRPWATRDENVFAAMSRAIRR